MASFKEASDVILFLYDKTYDSNRIHFEQQLTIKAQLDTYEAFLSAAVRPGTNMTVTHGKSFKCSVQRQRKNYLRTEFQD